MGGCEYGPTCLVPYSKHFIFLVNYNGPNKLEHLSLPSLSCSVYCNNLAYWAIHKLQRKWGVVNMAPGSGNPVLSNAKNYDLWPVL